MKWFIIIIFLSLFFLIALMVRAYHQGSAKTFKELIATVLALGLSSIGVRICYVIAPQLIKIFSIGAVLASLFFNILICNIIIKKTESRYNYITTSSRRSACILAFAHSCLIISLIIFCIDLYYPLDQTPYLDKMVNIFKFPVDFFWFFPKI